ncbi:MAG: nuclear transport factor 2 family protein [Pseudomonadota bacterium]
MTRDWLLSYFAAADTLVPDQLLEYFANDASFQMGNMPVRQGYQEIHQGLLLFYSRLSSMRHEELATLTEARMGMMEASAHYHLRDGRVLVLPVVTVLRTNQSQKVISARIYMDPSPINTAA